MYPSTDAKKKKTETNVWRYQAANPTVKASEMLVWVHTMAQVQRDLDA